MTNSNASSFRKPATVFIKTIALIAITVIVLGVSMSLAIKADSESVRSLANDAQQIAQASTQKGGHVRRDTQEKDSSLALLSWGGAALLCAAAFLGVAHRIHTTFGVKDNEP